MKHTQQSLELLHSMCSEQLSQRVKMGDHLDVPREVDHVAFFAKRADADAAAGELATKGFRVSVARRGFNSFALEAAIDTDVEWDTVDEFVPQMFDLITRHHGVYDGWGGDVVLKQG
jgi:hypothetical protein